MHYSEENKISTLTNIDMKYVDITVEIDGLTLRRRYFLGVDFAPEGILEDMLDSFGLVY